MRGAAADGKGAASPDDLRIDLVNIRMAEALLDNVAVTRAAG
jgi:hypothetical protein